MAMEKEYFILSRILAKNTSIKKSHLEKIVHDEDVFEKLLDMKDSGVIFTDRSVYDALVEIYAGHIQSTDLKRFGWIPAVLEDFSVKLFNNEVLWVNDVVSMIDEDDRKNFETLYKTSSLSPKILFYLVNKQCFISELKKEVGDVNDADSVIYKILKRLYINKKIQKYDFGMSTATMARILKQLSEKLYNDEDYWRHETSCF